ncbi:zinc finger imprinted 3-like isoform X2 [Galleria mellonella]|uniref:Zinc finger imprinted 3-like isoform X2 n=1 Tax=Galleria mellonella TaxID=7137 RepID=A0ABM3N0U4_GALME|nr:zinc finger imprinted 3-like isoform X2 [Galleria mellonella]XP_052757180.1 zinc finger imprinted 3-like isoform X2 [Galleria mellonella]XP_052757181.1 zinc finger imprinted 3-like isoform X2 [Galleria mellonella]
MSNETWKLEKDLCRCCHSEGSFKNLSETSDEGQEVYSDMLQFALDINVLPVAGMLCCVTYTICEQCSDRLRDAVSFKRQVLQCEERFRDMYDKDGIKVLTTGDLKVKEEVPEEYPEVDGKPDLPTMDGDDSDDFPLNDLNSEEIKQEDPKKSKPKKAKQKKKLGRPKKTDAGNGEKKGNEVDAYITVTDKNKQYTCKACEISYKRISDLRYHVIRTHLKRKFIKCKLCPDTFMYHSQRKDHMWRTHSDQKPEYTCGNCNRRFRRKNTLAEHMMDVHIEKKCSNCDLRFARKKLPFHRNEVHGVPMPTCGICGLRTLLQSALVRHQRNVHLNEKDKRCSICKKAFYTRSNLQDHMITHDQNRVFDCSVCGKTFARKECYKAHYRIHTGERPFACSLCSMAFVQRASLRFHMKNHHP